MPETSSPVCELKGGLYPLTAVRLSSSDLSRVAEAVDALVAQAPGFFEDAPLVLDVAALDTSPDGLPDAAGLIALIRDRGLLPVAVLTANSEFQTAIREQGVACLAPTPSPSTTPPLESPSSAGCGTEVEANSEPDADRAGDGDAGAASGGRVVAVEPGSGPVSESLANPCPAARIVTSPVRSGQQIYARDCDLIVLSNVNTEAEVAADGHVHVYGRLLGRAIAGAGGDESARIFASYMDPQLLSIAGNFKAIDRPDSAWQGKAAQVVLDGQQIRIAAL